MQKYKIIKVNNHWKITYILKYRICILFWSSHSYFDWYNYQDIHFKSIKEVKAKIKKLSIWYKEEIINL